jgi:hypothetical protein
MIIMVDKCSWPDCLKEAAHPTTFKYVYQRPEVKLCQYHYDLNQTADQCWEKIINTEGFQETTIIFKDSSISIFKEALLSYNWGLTAAVALLCRASMESAMHAYISSDNPKYLKSANNSIFMNTFNHNYECDNIKLKNLIKSLKEMNVLVNMDNKVNFVKDNGDFVAHHSERFWKSLNQNSGVTSIKLWVNDEEAKNSLVYTSEIISELIKTYYINKKP